MTSLLHTVNKFINNYFKHEKEIPRKPGCYQGFICIMY